MIGTLTSSSPFSSTNFVPQDFPAGIFPCGGTEIFPRKTFQFHLCLYSLHSRILNPFPLRSSPIISCSQQTNIEAAEFEGLKKSTIRTVRVRFQLRKECVFGEHFFIVGDDPVFGGLWDPEYALPLNWSDGHVWTLDLDLPVGRLVEFKFVLKARTGEILWQPGPNRALETWETNKSIRVCEDWDNADLQMMIDEDLVTLNQQVERPEQSVRLVTTDVSSNGAKEEEQVLFGTVQEKFSQVVVVDVGYVRSDDSDENLSSNRQSEKNMETSNGALTARLVQEENVTKEAMFTEEEAPVLVPGLIPLSDLENEVVNEAINEGKAETFPEVGKKEETKRERNEKGKGKMKAISLFEKSEREAIKGVEKMQYNAAEEEMQQQQQRLEAESLGTPNVLLEKDIQWGRRTLYKLLSNFGLF
ncbi:unnamed protein product [Microthlaspi erraticum]|uniref:CBM20 domain-containing protein n=1 Tax=Microthlaspi erraticum TaxID=1685480 RepID=A0A6D2LP20_9BRAS|nr:unnamed protein product [Microthlaspi erraticum]